MDRLSEDDRFIFIGGAPRSGTTLLQNILDSHPEILGGPEFLHLPDIIGLRNKLYQSISSEWIDDFCSFNDVDQLTATFIKNLLLPLADRHESKFLSEKTPFNVLVFDELLQLFPSARFIHVVRDPRGIISSMLQVGVRAKKKERITQAFTHNILVAINTVTKCFRAGFAASEKAPDRVLTIAYEQLIADPENETKRLCDFIGIKWSHHMLHPSNKKHLGEKAVTRKSGNVWYSPETYNRNPENSGIEKWETELTLLQQTMIAESFKKFNKLTQFGYGLSKKNPYPIELISRLLLFILPKVQNKVWLMNKITGI